MPVTIIERVVEPTEEEVSKRDEILKVLLGMDINVGMTVLVNTIVTIADTIPERSTPETLRILAKTFEDIAEDIEGIEKSATKH